MGVAGRREESHPGTAQLRLQAACLHLLPCAQQKPALSLAPAILLPPSVLCLNIHPFVVHSVLCLRTHRTRGSPPSACTGHRADSLSPAGTVVVQTDDHAEWSQTPAKEVQGRRDQCQASGGHNLRRPWEAGRTWRGCEWKGPTTPRKKHCLFPRDGGETGLKHQPRRADLTLRTVRPRGRQAEMLHDQVVSPPQSSATSVGDAGVRGNYSGYGTSSGRCSEDPNQGSGCGMRTRMRADLRPQSSRICRTC